jgi:hypothetical protein
MVDSMHTKLNHQIDMCLIFLKHLMNDAFWDDKPLISHTNEHISLNWPMNLEVRRGDFPEKIAAKRSKSSRFVSGRNFK